MTETWWLIEAGELLSLLRRARLGDDPDVLMLEVFANSNEDD